jgi:hypothetical protein
MSTSHTIPVFGPRARAVAVGLIATALIALIVGPSLAPKGTRAVDGTTTPEHMISVTGTGRVILAPDVADVQLGVTVQRTTVKAARDEAATAMTAVIAALKKAGIADKDLKTSMLSLQPQYDYSSNGSRPKLVGYQFSNAVVATVRDMTKLGDAIDASIAAGATSLDGVTFRVNDETQAEAQARTAAMVDAKAKADALASAAGTTITGVSSITETVAPTPYPVPFAAGGALDSSKAVSTPIQVGTNEVTVSVAVSYLIP